MTQLFVNNFAATVSQTLGASDTFLYVSSASGLPAITGGDYLLLTLFRKTGVQESGHEVVRVTAITGNLLTVQRAAEGAAATLFNVGDRVEARVTAQALAVKADLASPTFTGTVGGITAAMVGLGNVNNTADSAKPVSTAQAAALALKLDASAAYVHPASHPASIITQDTNNRFVTDAEKTAWYAKQPAGNYATGGGTATGTNTGDQTNITGNAGTATALSLGADRTKLDAITGTNTGDETGVGIRSKLGITTLTGSNTGDQTITLTGGVTGSGAGSFAATVVTNANLTGHVTSLGNATVLGSFTSEQLAVALTDETGTGAAVFANSPTLVTPALGTPASGVATNLTGTAAGLTAGNVTTNANLTGEVTSVGNASTVTNAAVINKVLTGYVSGAGTVAATDTILQAVNKLNGNNALKQDVLVSGTNVKTVGGVSILGAGNITAGTPGYAYDNRATLRTLSPANGDAAIVKDLGLFIWESASTEPDDDESAFATASGIWLLQAAAWDLIDSWQSVDEQEQNNDDEDEPLRFATSFATKILTGSATCAITSVASVSSVSFTGTVTGAAVGDRVIATPPAQLGSDATQTGLLGYHAWVSAANTVTVMLTNASAQAATTNTLIRAAWPVTVIKT